MSVELRPIMPNTIEECCQICEAIRDKKPVRTTHFGTRGENDIFNCGSGPDFAHFRYDLLERVQTQVELPELCYVLHRGNQCVLHWVNNDPHCELFYHEQLDSLRCAAKDVIKPGLIWRTDSSSSWQPVFKTEFKIIPFNK